MRSVELKQKLLDEETLSALHAPLSAFNQSGWQVGHLRSVNYYEYLNEALFYTLAQ